MQKHSRNRVIRFFVLPICILLCGFLVILCLSLSSPASAQKMIKMQAGKKSIWLYPGSRIGYLTDADTIHVAGMRPLRENETNHIGIVFNTGRITGFDTTAIYCGEKKIHYHSISYIYLKKRNLEYKIPGLIILLASVGVVFSAINTSHSGNPEIENTKMVFGVAGIVLGGSLTFSRYNPVLKRRTETMRINVVL